MKKTIICFVLLFFAICISTAQRAGSYRIDGHISFRGGNHHDDCNNFVEVIVSNMSTPFSLVRFHTDVTRPEQSWKDFSFSNTFDATRIRYNNFIHIEVRGERQWREWWPWTWGYTCVSAGEHPVFINTLVITSAVTSRTLSRVPNWMEGSVILKIFPVSIEVFSRNPFNNEDNNTILPTDDRIELSATTGFISDAYRWFYSFDNVSWQSLLPSFTDGRVAFEISARDFLTDTQIEERLNQNISFLVRPNDISTDTQIQIKTLTLRRSAPHIISIDYEPETCRDTRDAKINITFNRQLIEEERLYVSLIDNEFRERGRVEINSSNIGVIPGIAAGSYDISLLGVHSAVGTDTVFTFTDGARHRSTIQVHNRPALSLSLSQDSVRCRNGADGRINFTVSGGNGNFTAYLLDNSEQPDTLQRMSVTSGTHTFANLSQGIYHVYVRDTNGCDRDADGNKTQQSIAVLQPDSTVRLSVINIVEAHGYGLSTGWAEVFAQGGSGGYTFVWEKEDPFALLPQTSGTDISSRLENLPTGWYTVRVKDQNYNLAYPQIETNTCGCMDTVRIFIDQPPPLVVEVEETHVVVCHGNNDGQLQARASGGRPFNPSQDSGRTLPYNYEWFRVENNVNIPIGGNDSILNNLYAGYYRVRITDRNGIYTISQVFRLVEPDVLTAQIIVLQHVLCDGDSTGIAQVIVTGGTPPYTYWWTTENNDTTAIVENLSSGIYTVFVQDSRFRSASLHRSCAVTAHVNVRAPNSVNATATLTNPTCDQYSDGRIELVISGGAPPYRFLWEDGSTNQDRTNLTAGEYRVIITDSNDCSITETYILTAPAPIIVNLGGNFTLCAEQQITVRDSNQHGTVSYQWTDASGTIISTAPELTVSSAGTYKLTVITPEGCWGSDEVTVGQSDDILRADFVMASVIPRDRTIHAVNIINTDVDSVEWIIPNAAFVVEKTDHKLSISFARTGEYTIGFIGYLGKCRDMMYKTVKVVEPWEFEEHADTEPFLRRFIVSPNPSDGNFTVHVELREPADYQLFLFNTSGVLMDSKEIRNTDRKDTVFSRGNLNTGTYYLHFVSREHMSVFKLIIR